MVQIARIGLMILLWMGISWHVLPALAHKGHKAQAQSTEQTPQTQAQSTEQTPSPDQPPADSKPDSSTPAPPSPTTANPPGTSPPQPSKTGVSWRNALFSHVHNKIVHFPLALGLTGALLILLGSKWPQYQPAARLLLILAALSAIPAYFTGQAQSEPFEGKELESILELHEAMGITTAIMLWIGVVLNKIPKLQRWLWIYAILISLVLGVTGFLGGILAHS